MTFAVKNVGTRNGTEVAEVYVRLPKASREHFRRLAAWQRVEVNTGEQKTMTVPLEALSIAIFDEKKNAWAWLSGNYAVFVGGSSRDLPLQSDAALY